MKVTGILCDWYILRHVILRHWSQDGDTLFNKVVQDKSEDNTEVNMFNKLKSCLTLGSP